MEEEIKLIQSVWIPIDKIEENKGQIKGVPANPRKVSAKKFNILKKSIQEDSEMLGMRELLVFPIGGAKKEIRTPFAIWSLAEICDLRQ